MDASYYDYDFSEEVIIKAEEKRRINSDEARTIWSAEKVQSILNRAINPYTGTRIFKTEMSKEEKVNLVLKERQDN